MFTSLYVPYQRQRKRVVGERALTFIHALRDVFVPWIARELEKYVRNVYCHMYDTSRPPPSLSAATTDCKKHYVKVEPRFVWNLMERARAASVSLRQAVALRTLDEDAGCSVSQADLWTVRFHEIYWKRQSACIGETVHHVNIVCDPSTHSNKDMLVSVIWCWEASTAAYPAVQHILPGNRFDLTEQEMEAQVEALAAQGKLDRVSAFRQLQAVSHSLHQSTEGRMTLETFAIPEGVCLRPVSASEVRVLRPAAGGGLMALLFDRNSRAAARTLPAGLADAPLLVVGLDQGSVGSAGMSYAMHASPHLVYVSYDKIHRMVRDIRLSLQHCARGSFLKCQLFSAYIYGLNYKPFNSGAFSEQKARLLNVFRCTEHDGAPNCLKYWERIAGDLGLRAEVTADKSAVWDAVAELPTFCAKGSLPKMGRWFSWNQVAHEQMPEFWATKMLLEHHLPSEEVAECERLPL